MSGFDPITIAEGLPKSDEQWPSEVLDACCEMRSGDVFAHPPFFYYADPAHAIWRATLDYADGSRGPEIVDASEYRPPYGVITSQTCDVGEVGFVPPQRPWVMVAPVFDMSHLDSGIKGAIEADRHSRFLIHLPAVPALVGEFWVADLRIEMPVEKSALVGIKAIRSFNNDREQNKVGQRVSELRQRPAWGDSVIKISNRLSAYLKQTKRSDRILWDAAVREIRELGAIVDSVEAPTTVQLCAFTDGPMNEAVAEWWASFFEIIAVDMADEITVQVSTTEDLATCSVTRYREFAPINFRGFGVD